MELASRTAASFLAWSPSEFKEIDMYGNGNGWMGGGMFGGIWLLWLLILVLVVFGIIALAKFIFGGRPRS
jgi:hypothetical protein